MSTFLSIDSECNNVTLTIEESGEVVTLQVSACGYIDSVELSKEEGNQLEYKQDGLYSKPYSWGAKDW